MPQAAQAVAKLRWIARNEPEAAKRTVGVLQAHDWLVWQLLGRPARRTTDRGAASGTGYWSAATGAYRPDLVELALGHQVALPEVLGPSDSAGTTAEGPLIWPVRARRWPPRSGSGSAWATRSSRSAPRVRSWPCTTRRWPTRPG